MPNQPKDRSIAQEAELMRGLGQQLATLVHMGIQELREQYRSLFGEEARSKNLPFLRKKLAFRLQERVEGGLSPAAQAKLEELMPTTLPTQKVDPAPRRRTGQEPRSRDPRLPDPGMILAREHKGVRHEVEVLPGGFSYRGRTYTSLSAIAKEITGTAWNGFTFFGLKGGQRDGQV